MEQNTDLMVQRNKFARNMKSDTMYCLSATVPLFLAPEPSQLLGPSPGPADEPYTNQTILISLIRPGP